MRLSMFIVYIAASFIVLLGIGLTMLLISKKDIRESVQYRTIVGFSAVIFVFCTLYLYFYFMDMVMHIYSVGTLLRVVDYAIYGAIFFFWLRLMGQLMNEKSCRITMWSWCIGITRTLSGVIAATFLMDEYYCMKNDTIGIIFSVFEVFIVLLTSIVITKYLIDFLKNSLSSMQKIYVAFVSVILMLWDIQQAFIDSSLYMGRYISAWASGIPDTTAPAVFIIGLATFIFLFREDFSPIFYAADVLESAASHENSNQDLTSETIDPVELTAAQHSLTVRECEVLKLVYRGMNNPEIAEALFISRNTVKKHLSSIYEKTGVSSRMELAYLINRKSDGEDLQR